MRRTRRISNPSAAATSATTGWTGSLLTASVPSLVGRSARLAVESNSIARNLRPPERCRVEILNMSLGLSLSRPVLETLHFGALGKGFLRYRNPRRRRAGGNRKAFNEQAWREAAASLGASWRPLGSGFCEIVLGDVR